MKNNTKKMKKFAIVFIILSALMVLANGVIAASDVNRSFSSATPAICSNLTITLDVKVNAPDTFYAIDETYPSGWSLVNQGTGDTTQPGHLKWIVLSGALNTSYQYVVLVPCNAIGNYAFLGTYGFGTNPITNIGGLTSVNVITPTPITITPIPVQTANVGTNYNRQIIATGGSGLKTYSLSGTIPAGIAINSSTGLIAGIPTANGSYSFYVNVTDGTNAASSAINMNINARLVYTITPSYGANGMIMPMAPTIVNSSENKTFTITPNGGYNVSSVLVDGISVGAITSYNFINVNANHTIYANFTILPILPIYTVHNMTLKTGWNLISIPGKPYNVSGANTYNYSAESFGTYASADVVSMFNPITQTFSSHIVGMPILNFNMDVGSGYFVHVTANNAINITMLPQTNLSTAIFIGWNPIGWINSTSTAADSLGTSIGGDVVSSYSANSQLWQSHIVGMPILNFAINQGDGIFVHTTTNSTWNR